MLVAVLLVGALTLLSRRSLAEPLGEANPATAEALFDAGRKAMTDGDLSTACERFRESYRLDPAPGALLNLAVCEERRTRFARAWQHYRHVLEILSPSDERRAFVERHLKRVDANLAWVTLKFSADAPADVRVRQGGVVLTQASLGTSLPFDPGPVSFEVAAKGHKPNVVTATLRAGQRIEIVLEPGAPAREPPAVKPRASIPPAPASRKVAPTSGDLVATQSPNGAKTAAYIAIGTGAAALIASLVLGYGVIRAGETMESNCQTGSTGLECGSAGLDAAKRARTLSLWSTISFGVGAAGLGLGSYLWITAPTPRAAPVNGISARLVW
jgi:hypothetical protein